MSYYSIPEVHQAARRALVQSGMDSVEALLQRVCEEAHDQDSFDVFLACGEGDATLLLGVKQLLEEQSLRVYTDRFSAQLLPQGHVGSARLTQQKRRMRQSRTLLLVTQCRPLLSEHVAWMLGFFDGYREGGVAILPLAKSCTLSPELPSLASHYPLVVYPDPLMQREQQMISLEDFLQLKRCWCAV